MKSFLGEKISANGEHGHFYLYYMSPSSKRNGGILIGLEGSEYGKYSQCGSKHTISAESSSITATWGFKWKTKKTDVPDLTSENGPMKYNGMFVDLSKGWEYLIYLEETWDDDYVMETSKNQRFEKKKRERSRLILPMESSPIISSNILEESNYKDKITEHEREIEILNSKLINLTNLIDEMKLETVERNQIFENEIKSFNVKIESLKIELSQKNEIKENNEILNENMINEMKRKIEILKMEKESKEGNKEEMKELESRFTKEIEMLKKNQQETSHNFFFLMIFLLTFLVKSWIF